MNVAGRLVKRCIFLAMRNPSPIEVASAGSLQHIFRHIHLSLPDYKKRKTREDKKQGAKVEFAPKPKRKLDSVNVWRNMTVADFAKVSELGLEHVQEAMLYVKGAFNLEPNDRLEDLKLIKEIAKKCGLKINIVANPSDKEGEDEVDKDIHPRPPASPENLKPRPPVVTVMGHVDHGKTTLLDTLRGASVAAGEAGGITQHIGAFTVPLENGEEVTFLDTPGHAAFKAMRSRGASVTDIIVLVVAADDGVMEQTKEVVALAKAENVPMIVAVNKIDKPDADVERAKRELMMLGITLEERGGDTPVVPISALNGTNLEELVETISAQATLMGMQAEYTGLVEGVVVESRTDTRRGKLSTSIVTRGTLRKGCIIVSGTALAKVRNLFDHTGRPMDAATPGMPVEVLGWRDLPSAGDLLLEVESERVGNSAIRWRKTQALKEKSLDDLEVIKVKQQEHEEVYRREREERLRVHRYKRKLTGVRPKEYVEDESTPRVNVIVKGDVHGSVEAILDVLDTYASNDQCRLDIVHYGVGDVSDGDIEIARTFKAIIYAFSVGAQTEPPKDIDVVEVNIIYRLVDDLKRRINERLLPQPFDEPLGEANILQLFAVSEGRRKVTVLGCRCVKGELKRDAKYKIVRNGETIYDGDLESMRHLKSEVNTIKKDVECGLKLNNLEVEVKPGDTLVCYKVSMRAVETDWNPGF